MSAEWRRFSSEGETLRTSPGKRCGFLLQKVMLLRNCGWPSYSGFHAVREKSLIFLSAFNPRRQFARWMQAGYHRSMDVSVLDPRKPAPRKPDPRLVHARKLWPM